MGTKCWWCEKHLKMDEGINGGVLHPGIWCSDACKEAYMKKRAEEMEQTGYYRY